MLGGIGDVMNLMRNARGLKEKVEQMQAEAEARTYEADAGAGAVTVKANGRGEVVAVRIEPEAFKPSDLEMLEDLLRAATNAAIRKGQEATKAELAKMMGGLGLPGLGGS